MNIDDFNLIDEFKDVYGVDFFPPFDDLPSFILYDRSDNEMTDDIILDRMHLEEGVVKSIDYAFNDQVNTAVIIKTEKSKCQLGQVGEEVALICERYR
jgi:hypothetical protein